VVSQAVMMGTTDLQVRDETVDGLEAIPCTTDPE
jgi:hypothetical protein